jgi:hypothetical protein
MVVRWETDGRGEAECRERGEDRERLGEIEGSLLDMFLICTDGEGERVEEKGKSSISFLGEEGLLGWLELLVSCILDGERDCMGEKGERADSMLVCMRILLVGEREGGPLFSEWMGERELKSSWRKREERVGELGELVWKMRGGGERGRGNMVELECESVLERVIEEWTITWFWDMEEWAKWDIVDSCLDERISFGVSCLGERGLPTKRGRTGERGSLLDRKRDCDREGEDFIGEWSSWIEREGRCMPTCERESESGIRCGERGRDRAIER